MGKKLTAVVFPGQGAQFSGMGRDLFREFPAQTAQADRLLGYSIEELCLDDERLNRTEYTQPALYVVNVLHYLKASREAGLSPDFLAGHSLGEYCALFAAGAFDFETGLRLVQRRGQLMGKASGGGMSAVLNCSVAALEKLLTEEAFGELEIANYNSPSQAVVAGDLTELERLEDAVQRIGGTGFRLPVSAAFHSRKMQQAMLAFAPCLRQHSFAPLARPVISNFRARPYVADQVRDNLVFQIRHPVRWTESIWYVLAQGDVEFIEVGPKRVLSKLVAQIREAPPPPQQLSGFA